MRVDQGRDLATAQGRACLSETAGSSATIAPLGPTLLPSRNSSRPNRGSYVLGPAVSERRALVRLRVHQQWGESPHRTEHWLSVVEGNCVVERRGGEQPETNCQSINKTMLNTIRPDALASLLGKGEAQNRKPTREGARQLRRPHLRREQ